MVCSMFIIKDILLKFPRDQICMQFNNKKTHLKSKTTKIHNSEENS